MSNVLLTNAGRAHIASAIQQADLFLAWGVGNPEWDSFQSGSGAFGEDERLAVGHTFVDQFTVSADGVAFVRDEDYSVDSTNGVLTRIVSGRIVPGGSVDFNFRIQPPPSSPNATALVNELGRRKLFNKQFVTPDNVGDVVVAGNTYSRSSSPTRYLLVTAAFDTTDEPDAIIREAGVVLGGAVQSGGSIPAGQLYFPVAQVTQPGTLLLVENFDNIQRTALSREVFSYVLTF